MSLHVYPYAVREYRCCGLVARPGAVAAVSILADSESFCRRVWVGPLQEALIAHLGIVRCAICSTCVVIVSDRVFLFDFTSFPDAVVRLT